MPSTPTCQEMPAELIHSASWVNWKPPSPASNAAMSHRVSAPVAAEVATATGLSTSEREGAISAMAAAPTRGKKMITGSTIEPSIRTLPLR